MARRILDTSYLIRHWRDCRGRQAGRLTPGIARTWAQKLIELHTTNAIVSPVYVEFLAGVQSKAELEPVRAYLSEFTIIDQGKVLQQDWEKAKQYAARVPEDGKPRQLGDCLIRAIATRLRYEVSTLDKRLRR